jgi:hypothetical protein
MSSPDAEQRAAIRKELASLRRLLNAQQPVGMHAILQEVGSIECELLAASESELPGVSEKHGRLMKRLKVTGIITPDRWEKFFGES